MSDSKPPVPPLTTTGTGVTTSGDASIDLRAVVWAAMREEMDGILFDVFADLFERRWASAPPFAREEELVELAENLKSETLDFFGALLAAQANREGAPE
ncbi:MAG: hypothetical protein GWN87_24990 [Desulfuromonadales bacterium]|nr:hypothetical protein [Desulfuromonadales bacterium]